MPTIYQGNGKIENIALEDYIDINRNYLDLNRIKRIVFKVGSKPLANPIFFYTIAENLSKLVHDYKKDVILVSSGAIMTGRKKMGHSNDKEKLLKQSYAAIGQHILMSKYEQAFDEYNQPIGQNLLTREDINSDDKKLRVGYENTVNTLDNLLKNKVVPIINENDTVSIDEIKFGENDVLAAFVANSMGADVIVYITTTPGLYNKNPNDNNNILINLVTKIDDYIRSIAHDTLTGNGNEYGTGGMKTKVESINSLKKPLGLIVGKDNFDINKIFVDYTYNGTLFLK